MKVEFNRLFEKLKAEGMTQKQLEIQLELGELRLKN